MENHMKNKYCIFDLETTIIRSFKRFCNPFDKRNRIVVCAFLLQGEDPEIQHNEDSYYLPLDKCNFLVGHNVKFDLLYMWDNPELQQWLKDGGRVWDTMTAEYLLTAQQAKYVSLDKLTEQYGGELKDDRITQLFKAGRGPDTIDPEMLLPYAENDVVNTETIVIAQSERARKKHMMPIILAYMDHYLALSEMEYKGLYFDVKQANILLDK